MFWMGRMKVFEDIETIQTIPIKKSTVDKAFFIKRNMAKTFLVDRPLIQERFLEWLLSFPQPITKKALETQVLRLSADDSVALIQIENSMGISFIVGVPKPEPAILGVSIEEQMMKDHMIALIGRKARKSVQEFAEKFDLCVLDVDMLITQCPTANVKGKVPAIIQEASLVEVLPIIGLEKHKALNFYLKTVLDSLFQVRADDKEKYTIFSWTEKNALQIPLVGEISKDFKIV